MATAVLQPRISTGDPDETREIRKLIAEVVPDSDVWIDAPNPQLGGRCPVDFIGEPDEIVLRDLLRGAKQGYCS